MMNEQEQTMGKVIRFVTNASGDWIEIEVDGEVVISGHRLSVADVEYLAQLLGAATSHEEVSDEEMEEGTY